MDDRELEEQLLPKLVQLHGEPLDPNLLAAYVDGALTADEHDAVAAQIASDPDALLLVQALRADRAGGRVRTWSVAALAATVLLAVGLWWTYRGNDTTPPQDLQSRLAAVAADLRRADPDGFGAFRPLGSDELATAGIARGGLQWFGPLGVLQEPPRELRWGNPPDASRVEIVITGRGVRWEKEIDGERAAAPALEPGRYVVTLRSLDALAGQRLRRAFEILDADGRAHLERRLARIRSTAPADLAELLVAHYAAKRRLYELARASAQAARSAEGEIGKAAEALLAHVDARAAR